jgi:hypothetical protein
MVDAGRIFLTNLEFNAPSAWVLRADTLLLERRADMTGVRMTHGLVYNNYYGQGSIYSFGGSVDSTPTALSEIYRLSTDTWTETASLPTASVCVSAASIGDKIFVAGHRL